MIYVKFQSTAESQQKIEQEFFSENSAFLVPDNHELSKLAAIDGDDIDAFGKACINAGIFDVLQTEEKDWENFHPAYNKNVPKHTFRGDPNLLPLGINFTGL